MAAIYVGDEDRKHVHSDRFPIDFRPLLVGASDCGKKCLLMRLLLEHNLLNYNKLYVFTRSLYQPQYQILRAGMENELPKEDIIQLLNSQQIIKCEETSIDEVAKGLRIDNNENGTWCKASLILCTPSTVLYTSTHICGPANPISPTSDLLRRSTTSEMSASKSGISLTDYVSVYSLRSHKT